ncbi:MAG: hypothetical protein AAGK32_16420, partial [Actinomycetota bacterium]
RWHTPLEVLADLWLWIVGALAIVGLVLLPAARRAAPIWLPIVLLTLAIAAGVAEPHYRYPVVPLVAVLAAATLHRWSLGSPSSSTGLRRAPPAGPAPAVVEVDDPIPTSSPASAAGFRVAPLVVSWGFAAVLAVLGRATAAIVLVLVVLVVTHASAVSPRFARALDAGIERIATWASTAIGWLLLTVTSVLVILPASAVAWLVRPFTRERARTRHGWVERPTEAPVRTGRTFGLEPRPSQAQRRSPLAVRVMAGLAVLVVADVALGAVLAGSQVLRPVDRGDLVTTIEQATSGNMSSPVFDDEPWSEDLAADMAAFELQERPYEPFLVRPATVFESEYINTTGEERVSYRPSPSGDDPLKVAFFGGSVVFGMGQRDEHTIPSAVARAAESDGVELEVHNYGLPGQVARQPVVVDLELH